MNVIVYSVQGGFIIIKGQEIVYVPSSIHPGIDAQTQPSCLQKICDIFKNVTPVDHLDDADALFMDYANTMPMYTELVDHLQSSGFHSRQFKCQCFVRNRDPLLFVEEKTTFQHMALVFSLNYIHVVTNEKVEKIHVNTLRFIDVTDKEKTANLKALIGILEEKLTIDDNTIVTIPDFTGIMNRMDCSPDMPYSAQQMLRKIKYLPYNQQATTTFSNYVCDTLKAHLECVFRATRGKKNVWFEFTKMPFDFN